MKKIFLVMLLAVCVVGVAQTNVLADTITINNVSYSGGQPYTGTIANVGMNTRAVAFDFATSIGALQGFCVEGSQSFNIPPPADYDRSAVDTENEIKAAFIADKFFSGGFGLTNDAEAAAQYAIWQLLQPNSSFVAPWTGLAVGMLAEADAAFADGYTGANWYILQNRTQQDFIAKVPEPGTMLLIGLGLLGLAGFGRRKFKS